MGASGVLRTGGALSADGARRDGRAIHYARGDADGQYGA